MLSLAGRILILLYICCGSVGLFTIAWTSAAEATATATAGGKEQGLGKDQPHCHSVMKKRNIWLEAIKTELCQV